MKMSLWPTFLGQVDASGNPTSSVTVTDVHPGDGAVSAHLALFCWNPGYRSCQLMCFGSNVNGAVDSYNLGPGGAGSSTSGHYGVANDPPITDLNGSPDPSRARAIDSNLSIRIKAGAGTYGTLVLGKMYGSLSGLAPMDVRQALMDDRHSVKRIEFGGGITTYLAKAGLANRDKYGDWNNSPLTNEIGIQEGDPLGGLFIVFEALEKATTDPAPQVTFLSNTIVQTELGLARNHLITREPQVTVVQGSNSMETGANRSADGAKKSPNEADQKQGTLADHAKAFLGRARGAAGDLR